MIYLCVSVDDLSVCVCRWSVCLSVGCLAVWWQRKAVVICLPLWVQTPHTWESWIWATITQDNQESSCSNTNCRIQTINCRYSSMSNTNTDILNVCVCVCVCVCFVCEWCRSTLMCVCVFTVWIMEEISGWQQDRESVGLQTHTHTHTLTHSLTHSFTHFHCFLSD